MLAEEKIAVLIFLGLIAAVYVFAAGALIRYFIGGAGRNDAPRRRANQITPIKRK
jgi:hypothetical protein